MRLAAAAAALIIFGVLLVRRLVTTGPRYIPTIGNPMVLAGLFPRILRRPTGTRGQNFDSLP